MTRYLGLKGEDFAVKHLESKGYKILARNFNAGVGEIDIIAMQGKTLVFAEVKTRSYTAFGGGVAAVTKAKQARIYKAAVAFLKTNKINFDSIRFDVLAITDKEIDHIEGAFNAPRGTL